MQISDEFTLRFFNAILLLSGCLALFFLFTNGIPLIQLGLLHPLKSKTRYVNLMIIFVSIFSGLFLLSWWRLRDNYQRLWIVRMAQRVVDLRLAIPITVLYLIYVGTLSFISCLRHWTLETRAFDHGIFMQAIWNTTQGDFLYSSLKGGINLMGDHVSPLLVLLAPLYQLFPYAETLLILQVCVSASCIYLIAYVAKSKLDNKALALIFALIYCFYLPTRGALHQDFHPEVLVEPFMILAFIFLERRKIFWFLLCLLIVISPKENMLGISFILGFYAFFFKRMRWMGSLVMIFSVVLFLFNILWVVPYFSRQAYFYEGGYRHLWKDGIFNGIAVLFNAESLGYILKTYAPFLFLSFFNLPTFILTLPILAQNVLSANPMVRSFAHHYTTGLTPFLFISSIYGFYYVTNRFNWLSKRKIFLALVLLLINIIRSGPSEYYYFWQILQHRSPHVELIRKKLREIPPRASVLTHNNFIPQIANRKEVYQFDYLTAPTKGELAQQVSADYVIFDQSFWEPGTLAYEPTQAELKALGYEELLDQDGLSIFKK